MILASAEVLLPPDHVYRALTKADEIEIWWGSNETYRMKEWKADVSVGGRYSVVVHRSDGGKFPASGEFIALNNPYKMVHTRKYDWDYPVLGKRVTTITFLFELIDIGTRVTVRHEGFEGCEQAALEHADGWERVLGWLDHYIHYNFYFPKNPR